MNISSMIRSIIFSMIALLIFCGTSSASFVFSLAPNPANVTVGGTTQVDLIATSDAPFDILTDFTITVTRVGGSSQITPLSSSVNTIGTAILFASANGSLSQVVGGFSFGTTGMAMVGDSAVYSISGASKSQIGGFEAQNYASAFTVNVVPEPTSMLMIGSVVVMGLLRRRRC